ncbi:MAG: type VI secretion system baseplate subunit TssG, partial [Desulfamplus sp.]|nr:type VI secretion system baseplate subunit TssG [Desulfamplus sp.]
MDRLIENSNTFSFIQAVRLLIRNIAMERREPLQESDVKGSGVKGSDVKRSDVKRSDVKRSDVKRSDVKRSDVKRSDVEGIDFNGILEKYIRIRPELSLRFPGTDITAIEKKKSPDALKDKKHKPGEDIPGKGNMGNTPGGNYDTLHREGGIRDHDLTYLVTATFLGLYGTSSPLPTFYTEDLIDELNDEGSIKRDFLDIIHHRLYPIFFNIHSKYNLLYKICQECDHKTAEILYAILGLENPVLRSKLPLHENYLKYSGILTQFPRSAEGLEAMVSDFFNLGGDVKVRQCVFRRVSIPEDQRAGLGKSYCRLGEDCVIGTETRDISG